MKKKLNLKKYKNQLLFLSLGGAGQIGVNVNLYHYKGQWIMIDCGIGFASLKTPGADILISDLRFIENNKQKLIGLILTHAHEDHIGAIPYLIGQLKCPIYTSKFTKMMLDEKFKSNKINKKHSQIIEMDRSFSLGPFQIESFQLNHSIPDNYAIVIKTDLGNILHTGDWRFDAKPLLGTNDDIDHLTYWGKQGILALVSDSTNIFVNQDSKNEFDLRNNILKYAQNAKGILLFTTFASNIVRLASFFYIAQKTKKKVIILGKAMKKIYALAQQSNYFQDTEDLLISPKNIFKYPRSSILVVATGSQGEPLGAINKIVNNDNPYVKLQPKDNVIFSSKIIPGNEKKIFNLVNILALQNIDYVTSKDDFVHSSGHAAMKDIITLYEILKPQIAIPVHGESVHIRQHYKIAKKLGVPEVMFTTNGKVFLIEPQNTHAIGEVDLGYYAIDGNYLVPTDSQIFKDRISLSCNGMLSVICKIANNNDRSEIQVIIHSPGLLDQNSDSALISEVKKITLDFLNTISDNSLFLNSTQEKLRKVICKFISKEMKKDPIILVNIID